VLGRRGQRQLEASGPVSEQVEAGFWYRWSRSVERRPALRAVGALIIVVVVALPVFSLRLGLADAGSDPAGTTTRLAYDMLAKGFGPGFNGPLELVTTLPARSDLAAFDKVAKAAGEQHGVLYVTPPRVSPSGKAAVVLVYPSTAPQSRSDLGLAAQAANRRHTSRRIWFGDSRAGGRSTAGWTTSRRSWLQSWRCSSRWSWSLPFVADVGV